MTDAAIAELRALCDILAPAGRESRMTRHMADAFGRHSSDVTVDWQGNVTATFGTGSPSVVLCAHMDEIGFVVRDVTDDGFLRVERVGGVGRRAALGSAVMALGDDEPIPGMIGLASHHLTPPADYWTVPPVEEWYIDIGSASASEAAEMGVRVGTFVTFAPNFRRLGPDKVMSKTLDNRISCWALCELARRFAEDPPPGVVHLLANVQEEFHLRGLIPAVKRLDPDLALTLDITPAADTPDLKGRNTVRLGGGPAVKIMDFHGRGSLNGLLVPEFLVEWIESTADAAGIPTQREIVVGVVTDGAYLPSLDIPTAALAVPTRYTHSPSEVVSLDDLAKTADLCEQLARRVGDVHLEGMSR
ncbi:M20/M25/M40 family metallo-hydrolase [Candidatus Poribacteria bacterium]|nr:M20/M25/M40 family metallo-hydrolase [Candidatus Poribacteria bacterium]MBT5710006.1 M20/M25/M40 family metallo-hydrolase [Candidatus Poribacteria bacterium]MBT7096733.1 M20/M25/M40 family metallo-hydrolase [Candidatus Poribacteria bacterium]MBT7809117.1 M20/M25/M40 family metallo-hydrolase [Candidatus Poribacteria bacterium]